jgi:hypothetical protein
MSYQAINRIKFAPVTPTQKLVLLALADCHHEKTGKCNPSIRYLMSMTGLSDRSIQRSIAELCNANIVTIQRFVGAKTGYHLSTFEHPNPRTTFAPEAGSPPNVCHPTPERLSPHPRTSVTPPPTEVRGASLTRSKQESNRESNKARTSPKRTPNILDEQWFEQLKSNPEFSGINIIAEYRLANDWCAKKGRVNSRRFFENWLSRCERPIKVKAPQPYQGIPGGLL